MVRTSLDYTGACGLSQSDCNVGKASNTLANVGESSEVYTSSRRSSTSARDSEDISIGGSTSNHPSGLAINVQCGHKEHIDPSCTTLKIPNVQIHGIDFTPFEVLLRIIRRSRSTTLYLCSRSTVIGRRKGSSEPEHLTSSAHALILAEVVTYHHGSPTFGAHLDKKNRFG